MTHPEYPLEVRERHDLAPLDFPRVLGLLWQAANGGHDREHLQEVVSAVWAWMHDNIGPDVGSSFLDAIPNSGEQEGYWLACLRRQVSDAD